MKKESRVSKRVKKTVKENTVMNERSNKIVTIAKYFLVFVLGIVLSCSFIFVAAEKLVNSKEVKYDNSTSGLTSTNVQDAIVELNNNATDYSTMLNRLNNIGKELYPVGSIFISVSNVNPSTFIGGTWVSFGTGRTLVGINTGDSDFNTIEKTGGSKTKTLAVTNIPAHTHSIPALSGTAASAGAHTHSVSGTAASAGAHTHSVSGTAASAGAHTHTYSQATGVGNHTLTSSELPGETVKMTYNTSGAWSLGIWGYYGEGYKPTMRDQTGYGGYNAGHNHPLNTTTGTSSSNGAHTHTTSGTAASAGAHTHTISGTAASAGAHTHTVTTTANTSGSTGSTTAFSTMDPYITVYMWKRTA